MATSDIWDKAKERASMKNEKARKQGRNQKIETVLSGPTLAIKLSLLLVIVYALFKYIPAYVNFNRIINTATSQPVSQFGAQYLTDKPSKWGFAAPLREYVKMKKAYVRSGKSLQVQYILPEHAEATLTIKRCKNVPIVELFECQVVQTETIEITGNTIGTQRLQMVETAMYVLESQVRVNNNERYDIVWRRT
ncbi:MAG: hypothetical protein ABJ275_04595 [Maricaulaceae bacterium]